MLIAMPGADGYDASGGSPQAGIEVGDTLIFVVDIVATTLSGPEGTPVPPKAGPADGHRTTRGFPRSPCPRRRRRRRWWCSR